MMLIINKHYKKLIFLCFVLFVILRLPSLFEPHWYGDEGIYSAVANEIRGGEQIYADVWDNKLPAIYYTYLLASFTGQTLFTTRILSLVAGVLTLIGIYQVIRKDLSKQKTLFTILASSIALNLLILEFNIANSENFFIALTTFAIYFFLNQKYKAAGLVFGLAGLFKFHPFIEAFVLSLTLIAHKKNRSWKNFFNFSIFTIIPLLVVSALFVLQGNFQSFVQSAFLDPFTYAAETEVYSLGFIFVPNTLLIRIIVFVLLISFVIWRNKSKDKKYILTLWLIAGLFGSVLSSRSFPHYLIEVIPALIILLAISLKDFRKLTMTFVNNTIKYLVFAFAFLAFFTQGYPFPVYINVNEYYQNFLGRVTELKSDNEYQNFFNKETIKLYHLTDFIKENYTKEKKEEAFFGDNNAWFYELSNTKAVSRYTTYYHLFDFGYKVDELIDSVKLKKPLLIAVKRNDFISEDFKKLVITNYKVDYRFNSQDYILYVRK